MGVELLFAMGAAIVADFELAMSDRFGVHEAAEFGFTADGSFLFKVSGCRSRLLFGLFTKDEEKRWRSVIPGVPCERNVSGEAHALGDTNATSFISGRFDSGIVLRPFYYSCASAVSAIEFEAHYDFRNGKHHLDSRQLPLLVLVPIFVALFGCLLLGWIGGRIWAGSFVGFLIVLTCTLASALVWQALYCVWVVRVDGHGFVSGSVAIVYYVFDAVYAALLYLAILLAAWGWCIVRPDFPLREAWWGIGAIVLAVGSAHLSAALDTLSGRAILMLLNIAGLFAFVYCAYRGVLVGRFFLRAHLDVIEALGIDARTTPVYRKAVVFVRFLKVLVGYVVLQALGLVLELVLPATTWIADTYYALVDLVLLSIFAFLFGLRRDRANAYLLQDGSGDALPGEFTFDQVEGRDLDAVDEAAERRPWDEGTPLPPAPVLRGAGDRPRAPAVSPYEERDGD